jgi:hypothetical protein
LPKLQLVLVNIDDTPREGSEPSKHASGLVGLGLRPTTSYDICGLL